MWSSSFIFILGFWQKKIFEVLHLKIFVFLFLFSLVSKRKIAHKLHATFYLILDSYFIRFYFAGSAESKSLKCYECGKGDACYFSSSNATTNFGSSISCQEDESCFTLITHSKYFWAEKVIENNLISKPVINYILRYFVWYLWKGMQKTWEAEK